MNPKPLIDWILARFPDTPKKRAKQWIAGGRVKVAGVVRRHPAERMPDPGPTLELIDRAAVPAVSERPVRMDAQLLLIYLDASIAVVDKGSGILSVPTDDIRRSALTVLGDFLKNGRSGAGPSLAPRYRHLTVRPVHRIDQFTTGLLCFALNPASRARLIHLFQAHDITRGYIAYADGQPSKPSGTWRHWVKLTDDRLRQTIVGIVDRPANRRGEIFEAVTHYEVVSEWICSGPAGRDRPVTKLRLRLETGRRHQIRVQAASVGLPLIGDRSYHPAYHWEATLPAPIEFPRQALHAVELGFEHPEHPGRRMHWTSDLPEDLRDLERRLKLLTRA